MRVLFLVAVCAVLVARAIADVTAVYNMLYEFLPAEAVDRLQLNLTGSAGGGDAFEIWDGTNGTVPTVAVSSNTLSGLTAGVGWYLRHVANCSVGWSGVQTKIAVPLPPIGSDRRISVKSRVSTRYYFSTEVHGYTTAFWSWDQWRYHIGWCVVCVRVCACTRALFPLLNST